MRHVPSLIAVTGVLCVSILGDVAVALDKRTATGAATAPTTGVLVPDLGGKVIVPKTTVVNLTEQECKDLDGEIKNASGVCLSGKACQTTGEDGTKHGVCITKAQ
jgi:hypothetical protein